MLDLIDATVTDLLRKVLKWPIDGPKDLKESTLVAKFAPNQQEQFCLACELGDSTVVKHFLVFSPECAGMRSKDGSNSLLIASKRGHEEVSRLLINDGLVDVDCQWTGNTRATPLMLWAEHGNCSVVKLLLEKGASVNLGDEFGTTPICEALKQNHPNLLELFHKAGADLNRPRIDGSTSIAVASEKGHLRVVESLFQRGGNLSAPLKCGASSLSLAAQNGHSNCVLKLLEFGCLVNTVDGANSSPLWIAAAHGHVSLMKPLFQACPGMTLAEQTEHNCNALEIALCTGNEDTFALFAHFFANHFGIQIERLFEVVAQNIMRVGQDQEKMSHKSSLGERFTQVTVSQDAFPRVAFSSVLEPPRNSEAARQIGNDFFRNKKFADAINHCEQAMKLDPGCPLAPSNAAEAALQLKNFAQAMVFARNALALSPGHKKSWFRYVKSLAGLNRAAEAYVWIATQAANTGEMSRQEQVDLCNASAQVSPTCYEFTNGLAVELCTSQNVEGAQFRVIATQAIRAHQVMSKEMAVVPWCNECHQDTAKLMTFLNETSSDEMELINGIFPRSNDEIPASVESLQGSSEKVKTLKPLASNDEVQMWTRALACAAPCAFDNGIHHFSSFHNHSCAPNCEVRSMHNLEVVANREILAGEELCISYRAPDVLDLHVISRQTKLLKGWGTKCFCLRCKAELATLEGASKSLEKECGYEAAKAFLLSLESVVTEFRFPPHLKAHPLLMDWDKVAWKKACVLNLEFQLLSRAVTSSIFQSAALLSHSQATTNQKLVAITLLNLLNDLELKGAFLCLKLLVEQRLTYIPAGSTMMHPIYSIMLQLIRMFQSAGLTSRVCGFRTEQELTAKRNELEQFIQYAEENSSLPTYGRFL